MPTINYTKPNITFLNVLSDGKFHKTVDEGTEGATRRDYETSDGKKGFKWELVADSIQGIITNITIFEGDFGKQIKISFGEGEDEVVVSLPTQSSFGEDFMKKLPNIDVDKEVKLAPYSFEDDNGKKRKGLTVYQGEKFDIKIQDYYHEKQGGKYVAVNGCPELPKKSKDWDSEEWKLYFGQVRIFLVDEIKKNKLFDKVKIQGILSDEDFDKLQKVADEGRVDGDSISF